MNPCCCLHSEWPKAAWASKGSPNPAWASSGSGSPNPSSHSCAYSAGSASSEKNLCHWSQDWVPARGARAACSDLGSDFSLMLLSLMLLDDDLCVATGVAWLSWHRQRAWPWPCPSCVPFFMVLFYRHKSFLQYSRRHCDRIELVNEILLLPENLGPQTAPHRPKGCEDRSEQGRHAGPGLARGFFRHCRSNRSAVYVKICVNL